jgi:putative ABC transport system permease protein
MMSTRWKKVARELRLHRGRTVLVIAAIALGITGAGSVLNTWSLLRRATREGYLATNPPAATLYTDSIDAALLERIGQLSGIERAEARRTVRGRVRIGDDWTTLVLFVPGDPGDLKIGRVTPEAGSWPPDSGELVIEQSSLPLAPVAVGDELPVTLGTGEPTPVRVSGIARDPGLAPGWMEHVVYGYGTRATLTALGGSPHLDELRITATADRMDHAHARRLAAAARAVLEEEGHPVHEVSVPEPGRHIHAAQMDSLFYTQAAFGLLALGLSGLLVFSLITTIMAGQVREIGMMKAVGARPSQVAGLYLRLALLLGLAAALPSLPLAAIIGRAYANFAAGLLNFDVTGYPIPLPLLSLQLGVALLIPVAAAAGPVMRGSRITVARAIRDYGIEDGRCHAAGAALAAERVPSTVPHGAHPADPRGGRRGVPGRTQSSRLDTGRGGGGVRSAAVRPGGRLRGTLLRGRNRGGARDDPRGTERRGLDCRPRGVGRAGPHHERPVHRDRAPTPEPFGTVCRTGGTVAPTRRLDGPGGEHPAPPARPEPRCGP